MVVDATGCPSFESITQAVRRLGTFDSAKRGVLNRIDFVDRIQRLRLNGRRSRETDCLVRNIY